MTKFPEFQSKAAHNAPSLVGLNSHFIGQQDHLSQFSCLFEKSSKILKDAYDLAKTKACLFLRHFYDGVFCMDFKKHKTQT